jgi:hypothetical protein
MTASLASKPRRTLVLALTAVSWIACGGESGDDTSTTAGSGGAMVPPTVTAPVMSAPPMTAGGATASNSAGMGGAAVGPAGTPAAAPAGNTSSAGAVAPSAGNTAAGSAGTPAMPVATEKFSFFVASYAAMQRLSGTVDGFGGDLRYGESDGLKGADKICTEIAEGSMKGAGGKGWRAFLSVTKGPDGNPVHAIDRVGAGPWYDRRGRLVAMTKADLMTTRPTGADSAIVNDLPNEDGVPNQAPDGEMVDNHDILTGTNDKGQVFSMDWGFTCHDWTSAVGRDGTPRVGHSWPRMFGGPGGGFPIGGFGGFGGRPPGGGGSGGPPSGIGDLNNWMSALNEAGCAPGASLVEMGPPNPNIPTVGSGGGYGGIYCFALMP